MKFLFPKNDSGVITVVVACDYSVTELGALRVLNDRILLPYFENEARGDSKKRSNPLNTFHDTYLDRIHRRLFSANGDFCPMMVDGIDLMLPMPLEEHPSRFTFATLSPREIQLCVQLWEGNAPKAIAAMWHRSELTIKKHRENLYQKLGGRLSPEDLNAIIFVYTNSGLVYRQI